MEPEAGTALAARTDTGCVRPINEDSYLLEWWPDGRAVLAVVADGMGGHGGGDVASRIVVETFRTLLDAPWPENPEEGYERLAACFHAADTAIRAHLCDTPETMSMGATAVAAVFTPARVLHLYAGDSRLYHFRAGEPVYRTTDHSIVQVLVDAGKLTPEDARDHPMRSVVTSCLGGGSSGTLSLDPPWEGDGRECSSFLEPVPGDVFLLCSDGLTSEVPDEVLSEIVAGHTDPEALVAACVEAARAAGGRDNITVLVFAVPGEFQKARQSDPGTCILDQLTERGGGTVIPQATSPQEAAELQSNVGVPWLVKIWRSLVGRQRPRHSGGPRTDGHDKDDF